MHFSQLQFVHRFVAKPPALPTSGGPCRCLFGETQHAAVHLPAGPDPLANLHRYGRRFRTDTSKYPSS
ncbi:Uncharacterised protein [Vibrio cholerae]|nr:Uncharacterised protein [Vibrio cholerae]